jgi:putative permease
MGMFVILKNLFNKYFSDPEAVMLLMLLVVIFSIILGLGSILLPVLLSIVIAYLLQWWVNLLERVMPHTLAYSIVYLVFLGLFIASILLLFPLLWRQLNNLVNELPTMIENGKSLLHNFVKDKDFLFSEENLELITSSVISDVRSFGLKAVSSSLSSITAAITWIVYIVLVPLLVFFFLKDKERIIAWFVKFLPAQRKLMHTVWNEMDQQIGNYIRGKLTEIGIVGFITYIIFWYFNLKYQSLLAVLVAISVIIPYIGGVIVTIPVVLVAYLQWGFVGGWQGDFAFLMYAYGLTQFLDGNILVPLLFSEAVNLHPVAVILAILIFGAIWGFWGIFFAIPLATLVKAILNSWPHVHAGNQVNDLSSVG